MTLFHGIYKCRLCGECFESVATGSKDTALKSVNCTPFVRQYGILFRKWGVFVCQRDNESTTELKR